MRARGGFVLTIATLIAAGRLDERLLDAALARLRGARLARWIDRGDAADIEADAARDEVRAAYEGWEGVDIVAHPPGPREKKLFVADMDSTMIGQECIDHAVGVELDVEPVLQQAAEIADLVAP